MNQPAAPVMSRLSHLRRLEAESIHIMREVAAEFRNPVMLYSIGKDSSVMLHLAMKAFYPSHAAISVAACRYDMEVQGNDRVSGCDRQTPRAKLLVHINEDGVRRGINPFDSGSALHTQVMKTEALKQALDKYGFDAAFGGARRDEEKSRAKERVFSFRTAHACLGSEEPAPGTLAHLQHACAAGGIHSRVPAVELDRTGRLAIRHDGGHPHRAAVFRQESGPSSSATAR